MTVTIRKRDGSTLIVGKTKPKGPTRFILEGRPVTLSEAARILDVGLRTVVRNTRKGGVIDVAAIRALVPGEPLKKVIPEPKPVRIKRQPRTYTVADRTLTLRAWAGLTGLPLDLLRQRVETYGWDIGRALSKPAPAKSRNEKIIARIASAFHGVAA